MQAEMHAGQLGLGITAHTVEREVVRAVCVCNWVSVSLRVGAFRTGSLAGAVSISYGCLNSQVLCLLMGVA